MNKYVVLYYIKGGELTGVHSTQLTLHFTLSNITLRIAERKLKKALNVDKVTILSYMLLESK